MRQQAINDTNTNAGNPPVPPLSQVDELRAADLMSFARGFNEPYHRSFARGVADSFRADLVQRVREQLAAAAYETEDRLEAAVAALHRSLISCVNRTTNRREAG